MSELKALTADDILKADDRPLDRVEVPEWGGFVYLRSITAAERDRFDQSIRGEDGEELNLDNVRAKIAAMTVCDAAGDRLFTEAQAVLLGAKSSVAISRIAKKAREVNGMDREANGAGKGDSAATGSGDSA